MTLPCGHSLRYINESEGAIDFNDRVIIIDPLTGIVQAVTDKDRVLIRALPAIVDMPADEIGHRIFQGQLAVLLTTEKGV